MKLLEIIDQIPWIIIIFFCATIGLAPYSPPHVVEKISMLINNTLTKPIDWFDLVFHGVPWLFLLLKSISVSIIKMVKNRKH